MCLCVCNYRYLSYFVMYSVINSLTQKIVILNYLENSRHNRLVQDPK